MLPTTLISCANVGAISVLASCVISIPSSVSASTLSASTNGLSTLPSINPSTSACVSVKAVNTPVAGSYCKSPAAPTELRTRDLLKYAFSNPLPLSLPGSGSKFSVSASSGTSSVSILSNRLSKISKLAFTFAPPTVELSAIWLLSRSVKLIHAAATPGSAP